nr:DeoR/GlpR transcriptional regulator [Bacilli bacterium]
MYPQQRREQMMLLLSKHGFIPIDELAKMLNVSPMTVRRDLNALEAEGQVQKVTGGGKVAGASSEISFATKRVMQQAEKHVIAKEALKLIEPGMTIAFSAGTTTWALAGMVRGFERLTFLTNSTNIAVDLSNNGWEDIVLTGGNFRTPSDALVGPIAEQCIRQLHTDIMFLGVHGIHAESGISTPNLLEAAVDRALMEQTDKVILLFDHTKWDGVAFAHIADLDEIDVAITDNGTSERQIEVLQKAGIEVVLANLEP